MFGSYGAVACSIFFFLSMYGIVKSLELHPPTFVKYFRKRVKKVLIPYFVINAVTIFTISFLFCDFVIAGAKRIDSGWLAVNVYETGWTNIIPYILGIRKIDGVAWFIDIILLFYIVAFFCMKYYDRKKACRMFIYVYLLFILYAIFFHGHKFEYLVDTIGLPMGFLYAHYEQKCRHSLPGKWKHILKMSFSMWLIFFAVVIFFREFPLSNKTLQWMVVDAVWLMSNACLVVFVAKLETIVKIPLSMKDIAVVLGGISLYVYLIHIKVCGIMYSFYHVTNYLGYLTAVLLFAFIAYKIECILAKI